ncbi:unnamed protein product, partial [Rotaria sp. Silwood2]
RDGLAGMMKVFGAMNVASPVDEEHR